VEPGLQVRGDTTSSPPSENGYQAPIKITDKLATLKGGED